MSNWFDKIGRGFIGTKIRFIVLTRNNKIKRVNHFAFNLQMVKVQILRTPYIYRVLFLKDLIVADINIFVVILN